MYNFENYSSLIIYVPKLRCRYRQMRPRVLFWKNIELGGGAASGPSRPNEAAAVPRWLEPVYASHVYPFNAQFPYNLTLRSKWNFAKSFPAAAAAGGGSEQDAYIGSSRDQMLGQISHSPSLYLKADP